MNFCIHFWNFFWVCLFPRNFWPIKEWRKIEKIVKNRLFHQNSQKSTNVDFFSKIPLQFFDFTPKVSLVWFWYSYDNFWWFYENLKKYFFYQKKTIFFKKSIFFSKTSIMEDLYIDVETWILHQFRRLYPQNFRFYTYFLNFMKKIDFVCFPDFYGIIYIYNIQKMMSYMHIAKYSWETDKLKLFL